MRSSRRMTSFIMRLVQGKRVCFALLGKRVRKPLVGFGWGIVLGPLGRSKAGLYNHIYTLCAASQQEMWVNRRCESKSSRYLLRSSSTVWESFGVIGVIGFWPRAMWIQLFLSFCLRWPTLTESTPASIIWGSTRILSGKSRACFFWFCWRNKDLLKSIGLTTSNFKFRTEFSNEM